MKSKKPYEILRQDTRNPAKLTRHPEAETPISDDDLAALAESVRERGLIDPILINEQDQVVDGCSRLEAALRAGLAEVPVTVVYCEDVRALACDSLIGRMRNKSQRVLAWVLKQGDQAAIAWNIRRQIPAGDLFKPSAAADSARKHYPDLKPAEVARVLDQFSVAAVATRLGVSADYAESSLQLVGCLKLKLKVSGGGAEKIRYTPLKEGSKADALYLTQLELAVENILRGDAQVTRWRAGVGGATATKDQRKAATNVGDLLVRSATSLRNTVWSGWAKLPPEDQVSCTQALTEAFEACPVAVAKALLETLGNVVAVEDQE